MRITIDLPLIPERNTNSIFDNILLSIVFENEHINYVLF